LSRSGVLDPESGEELRLALAAETGARGQHQLGLKRWRAALQGEGLALQSESWDETLHLDLSDALLQRWLAPGGSYRRQLRALSDAAFNDLGQRLSRSRGMRLPQELRHTLLIGRR
ncbi:MAG: hypothetical protein AB1Z21_12115, partial [Synechococcaceae cyanobacterium]